MYEYRMLKPGMHDMFTSEYSTYIFCVVNYVAMSMNFQSLQNIWCQVQYIKFILIPDYT